MAAGAWKAYGASIENVMKTFNLDTDSFRLVLLADTYTPDASAHTAYSDISAHEVSGTGYTAGGAAIGNPAVSRSGLIGIWDGDDVSWAGATITAKYAVIVRDADANGALVAGDAIMAYCDLDTGGGSVSSTAAPFTVTMNASGIYRITAAA